MRNLNLGLLKPYIISGPAEILTFFHFRFWSVLRLSVEEIIKPPEDSKILKNRYFVINGVETYLCNNPLE